jgi:hypothetical protein
VSVSKREFNTKWEGQVLFYFVIGCYTCMSNVL